MALTDGERKAALKLERQNRKREIRREQLIDCAERLFEERGYDHTTLAIIADEIGYQKRTLYLYFQDKEEIFAAVVVRALRVLRAQMTEAIAGESSGYEELLAAGRAYYEFAVQQPGYFESVRLFEMKNYYYRRPMTDRQQGPFAVMCQDINDGISELLRQSVERGIQDGSLRNDLPPLNLLLILWGATFGFVQVLQARRSNLEQSYGTSEEDLFQDFEKSIGRMIRP